MLLLHVRIKQTLTIISLSPWLSNREAVDPQHPPQRVLGAVDDVLLLLVVQLLLDDVLTQVEHDLKKEHQSIEYAIKSQLSDIKPLTHTHIPPS